MKVEYKSGQFIITEIREGFNADLCGLQPGMVIEKYNGVVIKEAIKRLLPKSATTVSNKMYEYAGYDLIRYLEFHYEAYANKADFIHFSGMKSPNG